MRFWRTPIFLAAVITILIFFGVVYFLLRQMTPVSLPGGSGSAASSSVQGGTVTSSLMVGIGWKTYRNQLLGIELQYPIDLVIGRAIKPNTNELIYLWVSTDQYLRF